MRGNETGITVGIESAIDGGSLSLFSESDEIDVMIGEKGISRAEDIMPNLDQLLLRNDMHREQIGRVVVSTGPGSFTGIKIGISTAMGLADGLGIIAVGISALEALAYSAATEGSIIAAVPVGRDLVAAQHFQKTAGYTKPLSGPDLVPQRHFAEEVRRFEGVVVLHSELIERLNMIQEAAVVNAGRNIASLLVRAGTGLTERRNIKPLFIDRKPLAVAG